MDFSRDEMELLYIACMNHGKRLSDSASEFGFDIELSDMMTARAKKSYNLAAKVTTMMKENNCE